MVTSKRCLLSLDFGYDSPRQDEITWLMPTNRTLFKDRPASEQRGGFVHADVEPDLVVEQLGLELRVLPWGQRRVVPLGDPGDVVDVERSPVRILPLLPTFRQRRQGFEHRPGLGMLWFRLRRSRLLDRFWSKLKSLLYFKKRTNYGLFFICYRLFIQ